MSVIQASSVASFAMTALGHDKQRLRVLARFDRHVYALVGEGDARFMLIFSPVSERMTPYTVRLETWPVYFDDNCEIFCNSQKICNGELIINLSDAAEIASDCPVTEQYWRQRVCYEAALYDGACVQRHSEYLAAVLNDPFCQEVAGWSLTDLRQGLRLGDKNLIAAGVAQGLGLGRGLTPAGDDFLCGVMLATYVSAEFPSDFFSDIFYDAQEKTTTVSYFFLKSASYRHASEDWQKFLQFYPLIHSVPEQRLRLVRPITQHGYSSGEDTLAGFLWGLNVQLS